MISLMQEQDKSIFCCHGYIWPDIMIMYVKLIIFKKDFKLINYEIRTTNRESKNKQEKLEESCEIG